MTAPDKEHAGSRGSRSLRTWLRLLRVHKAGLVEIRDELSGEVTLPRFDLLSNLDRDDGQTLASLSRHMLVTAGNLTGLVDRAERDGLVERRADLGDRRATRIHLTRRGRRVHGEAVSRHGRRVEQLFAALGAHELDTLSTLLDKVRDHLRSSNGAGNRTGSGAGAGTGNGNGNGTGNGNGNHRKTGRNR